MAKTGIVCTIGPATDTEQGIRQLVENGMTIARCNCSHGTPEQTRTKINMLKKVRETLPSNKRFQIMLDTKGPDVRIGTFANEKVMLKDGQEFTLTTTKVVGDETRVHVDFDKLPTKVKAGQLLLLNDGMIRMTVMNVTDTDVVCAVDMGGELKDRKTMFAPGCELDLVFLSDADKADLKVGVETGVDMVAASFVGNAGNVNEMRDYMKTIGTPPAIMSKIESVQGIKNLEEIAAVSQSFMVARGDLGVEYPVEQVPAMQKLIISTANKHGKFVVCATEMMESMITKSRPTRAEVADVYQAVLDGADAVMTSAETAVGKYPFLTIDYMRKILEEAEKVKG